jgi:hypothetical protein
MEAVQNTVLRRMMPVYRTTPQAALQQEAGIPLIEITLDAKVRSAAARIHRLDF